ncbi:forkhead box protein unc-130-like [Montipora capricornis]|uniref:forkhead box protein unc-130-like n=1 Tax=Montipora capricornis TaxID=246305 RepID=UPI0035F18162
MDNIPGLSKYLLHPRISYHDFRDVYERDLNAYSEKLLVETKKEENDFGFGEGRIEEVLAREQDNVNEVCGTESPKKESDSEEAKDDEEKVTDEDNAKNSKQDDRNSETFVAVIAQAILSVPTKRMTLSSIYSFIARNYPHFDKEKGPGWRNSVRHNLSSNDCFVKASRAENGKGHYWMIHPKDLPEFIKGNFRRRRKPRRPKCSHPLMFRESPFLYHSFSSGFSTFPYTGHLRSAAAGDIPTGLHVPLPYGSPESAISPAFRPRLGLLHGFEDTRSLSSVSHAFTYPTPTLRLTNDGTSSRNLPTANGLTNFHGSFHYPCACHR